MKREALSYAYRESTRGGWSRLYPSYVEALQVADAAVRLSGGATLTVYELHPITMLRAETRIVQETVEEKGNANPE